MGQEIDSREFTTEDFDEFLRRLKAETQLLADWFKEGVFVSGEAIGGLELEACLLDQKADPAPLNQALLEGLDESLVVPELATFNVEINSTARPLQGDVFEKMASELQCVWDKCNRLAEPLGARMGMIGILPTLQQHDLSLQNMSPLNRYQALNDQVFRLRQGKPLELHIDGRESLDLCHDDVMLESAATSFQIHMQVDGQRAATLYNLSKIASAPMVAVSANSPFLFEHDLWDETRIPLFEQSIAVGASDLTKRVSFGIRYLYESMMENFQANLLRYPVLLPLLMDEPIEKLAHLRLHNGTVWRWNRPLIGFSESGKPHLRIEHRVVPAGPTVIDSIANTAFYFGLVVGMAEAYEEPETQMGFIRARSNFYNAARFGLKADLFWFGWESHKADELIRDQLLTVARQGLNYLDIEPASIDYWLGIIEQRVVQGINGAIWQREWVARHGRDFRAMTDAYLEQQESGKPVHEWHHS
ncbi:MAG: glutamate--cysteine ligase [Candidatus Thiodiazotropha sp. (ex Lucinoma annulata)]|nr:glutamate--cysteine ligase [Candidatus Thiodiazotropha sp. (ex Troendleina suluensis)]MCU7883452.1 glutamate--cysteine ligase [Candidatus Thiodiazotropha sp. (ex Lucinoma annulata)]